MRQGPRRLVRRRKSGGRSRENRSGPACTVSVTLKRTVSASLSRTTLPASTRPPMRKARSRGASWAATWLGVKKKTRLELNAFSTRAAAAPSADSPATIQTARLVLGFKFTFLLDEAHGARAACREPRELGGQRERCHCVRHPDVEIVAHSARTQCVRRSRSRMIARARTSAVPIEYIQNARAMSNMPASIETCIEVPLKLTPAPWCREFHHFTEK